MNAPELVIHAAGDGRFWITVDDGLAKVEIPAIAITNLTWHLSAGVPLDRVTVELVGNVTVHTP